MVKETSDSNCLKASEHGIGNPSREELGRCCNVARPGKEVSLCHVAPQVPQLVDLVLGFSSFCHNFQPESLCQGDYGSHDLTALPVVFHCRYKNSVDLQSIDRK